jgi:YcxB-like protein
MTRRPPGLSRSLWGFYYAPRTFHSAEVSQNSICFRRPLELRKVRLDWFTEYLETAWEIQLYVSEDTFYLLPKSSFSPKQLVEFRNLLRASSNPAFQGISC